MKNLALEHSVKVGEGFVLSLDSFISPAIQGKNNSYEIKFNFLGELLDDFLSDTKFNDIVRKKEGHKARLIKFRKDYEEKHKIEK